MSGVDVHGLWAGLAVLLLAPAVAGQARDAPRFDKDHVVPYGSHSPGTLTPGQFVSVMGWHLKPERWCDAPRTARPPYPLTICGVQVLVGGRAAGLMYVGTVGGSALDADQINFQVPADVVAEGEVPIQVCVAKSCSEGIDVPFTNKDILLRVAGKAYVHMPLWVDFTIPLNDRFLYPPRACPWDFDGFQIEFRKDGQVLPSSRMPNCPKAPVDNYSSSITLPKGRARRLPVHLYRSFDAPGEYEIRMSGPLLTPDLTRVSRIGHSEWIHVTVGPFPEQEREAWLDALTRAVSSGNPRKDTEVIVSLLAQPDEKALQALLNILSPPRPDVPPKGTLRMDWARDCLAPSAVAGFPDALLEKFISSARLAQLRAPRGGYCNWY